MMNSPNTYTYQCRFYLQIKILPSKHQKGRCQTGSALFGVKKEGNILFDQASEIQDAWNLLGKKVVLVARSPNEKAEKALELYRTGMKLVDVAAELGVPAGTVRRWKSTYQWDGEQKSERSDKKKANVRKEYEHKKKAVKEQIVEVMQNEDLTDKQQLFCIYYTRCFNATKAYQKAYGANYETAMANGSRMLRNATVKKEIENLKQNRLNRELLSEEDIFQKYMDIAFADITDYTEFGQKSIKVINPATGEEEEVAISYVNIKDSSKVDGTLLSEVSKGRDGVKVKLSDRMKALKWLSEHMDMATEKQRAEIALIKARADAGKEEKEDKLDKFFEQLESGLKDAE